MRTFEKISKDEFIKNFNIEKYDDVILPHRKNKYTAGYDIYLVEDINIKPGEIIKIPTGIKAKFEPCEVLFLIVRSSIGFKYNIRLCNQVGVIDSDYYNNEDNEGHIFIKLQNEGNQEITFSKGTSLVQGIFLKYLTTSDDLTLNEIRKSDK